MPKARVLRKRLQFPRPSTKEGQAGRYATCNRAHIAAADDDDSDSEPFRPGTAKMAVSMQPPRGVWYLDFCASRHLTNNKKLFVKDSPRPKSLDFTTAGGQIVCSESIGTIDIPLADGSSLGLNNVAYAPDCDSNLISLGQLRESGITYVDNTEVMTLMQAGVPIAHARRDRNLFILDLASPNKAMQVTGPGLPTHLVSKNKKVRVWHRSFGHASNARIIRASKLLTGMGSFDNAYDPTEIYSDTEQSESDDDEQLTDLGQRDNKQPVNPDNQLAIPSAMASVLDIPESDFDRICTLCIASKQTRVVIRNKSMTEVKKKLEEVHVDLWGLHYPPSLSGKTYAAILLDAAT